MKLLFLLLFLVSCGGLPPDNTPAPIDHGLWTLEMSHEGQTDVGLLGTTFSDPADRFFSIPLWGEGSFHIRSKRCAYEHSQTYDVKGISDTKFFFTDLTKNMPNSEFACVFNVQLFVKGMDKGLQGQFYLLKDEGFEFLSLRFMNHEFQGTMWYQVRSGSSVNTEIKFEMDRPGQMFFAGCGNSGEKTFSGSFSVPLEFFTGPSVEQCIYTIGVEFEDGSRGIAEFNLKVFKETILPLPQPQITYDNGKLKVESLKPVGYTAIDDKFKKCRTVKKKVGDKEVTVRFGTANGRYGLLKVKEGVVTWTPSIRY